MISNRLVIIILLGVIGALFLAVVFLFLNRPTSTVIAPVKTVTSNAPVTPLPTAPQVSRVSITRAGFIPPKISVSVGEVVTWKNDSGEVASVSSDPIGKYTLFPALNLGQAEPGSSLQTKFDKPGTYTYHNFFKDSQKGTIIVE